jgi:serine/threonine protein kinase
MALTIGMQLGSYEITELLGKGGMGEVYRARDLKLKREVAIKILPEEFARDSDRGTRFQREAEVLASLNHPNIAAIHDLKETGGTRYFVLELVEGETLADRLIRGSVPLDEAVQVAKQIVDALEAAHERGIVHRDLKPGNIKIGLGGRVKVLDFGLAKVASPLPAAEGFSNSPTLMSGSMGGVILGTAPYMSPEQASGKTVDARSDIFSLGAVLYEMLSGRRAFNGDSSIAMMAAVLRDEPHPLQSHPELVQIVRRCLCKSPADRFQTMTEVKASIAAVKLGEPTPSIAVLPFANMSDDKEQEYFSDGLAEEIINALAQIPGLKVTARTSAFAFRGKEQDITKIAEALHVSSVLEGSVRKSGKRLRVTAQLINAAEAITYGHSAMIESWRTCLRCRMRLPRPLPLRYG